MAEQRFGCYIGNIDSTISLDEFRALFSQCGPIIECSLNGSQDKPFRYGFIDFASEEGRANAKRFDGYSLKGRSLKVNDSKGNVGRPQGSTAAPAGTAADPGLSLLQLVQTGVLSPESLTEQQR